MRLISIQIGKPKTYGNKESKDPMLKQWRTAFYKQPVQETVSVTKMGIEGDSVADRRYHGGFDKAVLVYSADRYDFWRDKLSRSDIDCGAFGENFSVSGLNEDDTCIGDRIRIGDDVVVEVSQPREPCWKLGRRWENKMLPKYVVQTGFTGWYVRVIEEGDCSPDAPITLVDRPRPDWTITRANDVLYGRVVDATVMAELFLIPELSAAWKKSLG